MHIFETRRVYAAEAKQIEFDLKAHGDDRASAHGAIEKATGVLQEGGFAAAKASSDGDKTTELRLRADKSRPNSRRQVQASVLPVRSMVMARSTVPTDMSQFSTRVWLVRSLQGLGVHW